jgi:transcriptional regulator with XRE-family HTH domain
MPVGRNENDAYEIGQKIRARRKELRLSQDDLADRMGTDRGEISRHENGVHEMSLCTLIRYAEALQTTPQQLYPDRLKQDSESDRLSPINRILSRLSESSLQTIYSLAEHLQNLESKMQQI